MERRPGPSEKVIPKVEAAMIFRARRPMATLLVLALLLGPVPAARAAGPSSDSDAEAIGRVPPRLSYVAGEVSFWRPGATDWAPAQINTPLAPGDELYTANQGNLELQVGARAFVRAWGDTQLGLANQEPDFLQFKVTSGHASIDLRKVEPGRTVEIDTPHAAFIIEQPGYYRADVTEQRTVFVTRRGGQATVTAPGGQAVVIAPNQAVILEGAPTPTMRSYAAPELDTWDRWNYARTDQLIASTSARYVPPDLYGARELDQYGSWRTVEMYGSVWVPAGVPAGWVPYSTGRWIWDPFYGWTWVDAAPWGWAPYHYGRWVFVSGYWAWAPGPIVVRPVYAPALVVFFGAPGIHVSIGAPVVGWVALGWGEPVVPWWGRPSFVGRPWWGGWGGPRVVNNVVINRTTVVNVNQITVYRNAGIQNAVVAVQQDHFGRRAVQEARVAPAQVDVRRLEPVRGRLQVTPAAASFVAASGRATRPPEAALTRPVVATRPHAERAIPARPEGQAAAPVVSAPAPRIVPVPKAVQTAPAQSRLPQPDRTENVQRPDAGATSPREGERRQDVPPPPRGQRRGPEATPSAEQRGSAVRGPEATPPAENRGVVEPKRQPPSPGPQEMAPPPPRGQRRAPELTPPAVEQRGNQERGNQPGANRERESRVRGPEATPPPKTRGPVEPPSPGVPAAPAPSPQRVEPPRPSPQPSEPANRPGQGGAQMKPAHPAPGAVAAPRPAPPPAPSHEPGQRREKDSKDKS
jgi:hypothetical protein